MAIASAISPSKIHRKHGKLYYNIKELAFDEDLILDANGVPDETQNPDAVFIGATDAGYEFSAEPTFFEELVDEEDAPVDRGVDSVTPQISFDALEVLAFDKMSALIPFARFSTGDLGHQRITGGGDRVALPAKPVVVISRERTGGFVYAMLYAGYNSSAHTLQFKKTDRSKQNMVIKGLAVPGREDGDRSYRTARVDVEVLAITTASPMAGGNIGVAYDQAIVGDGGVQPYSFVKTVGALPPGLALDADTGHIAGMPIAPAGVANFTVRLTDDNGVTVSKALQITIAA